ncbi:MAG: peptidoglycan DD-metalloendopeptidase family protein [Firmicutes bacterium]|nr:peptidoglycan DD-metalloendopeptidase family protein [Bacillota bacterium]
MKRKSISLLLIFVLVFTFSVAGVSYAETKEELQNKLDNIEAEKEEVSNRLAEVQQEIEAMQPAVDKISAEVAVANSKVAEIETKIQKKQIEMQEREDGLHKRLRVMYKNGSVGFLDVLLGSSSISELVSNLEMIQMIYKNDMKVLETLKKEQEELKVIQVELKKEKEALASKKAELDVEMSQLNSLKSELEETEDKFLAEAKSLANKIKNMTKPEAQYVGGTYVWPVPSSRYITSQFGWRIHPIFNTWKYHSGTDIAASNGATLLACASGTVIMSQWYSGYGNCIIIDHGGGITSLYGHLSSRSVSVGQQVTGGQVIGAVGSTGWSTGPHLHLEFTKNGELVDPLAYIK